MLNDTYVFTPKGLEAKVNLNSLNSLWFTEESKCPMTTFKFDYCIYVQDSVDDISFSLNLWESIKIYRDGFNTFVNKNTLQVDDWIYHPWINPPTTDKELKNIDLASYSDNYYNLKHVFVFKDELNHLSNKFNIPLYAIKEIFVREAAEYEEHIPELKKHIEEKYCKWEELPKYISDHLTYKMKRIIQTDNEEFIHLLAALYFHSSLDLNSFSITFELSENHISLPFLNSFFKRLNTKVIEIKDKNKTYIKVSNKPFFQLYTKYLQFNMHGLQYAKKEFQDLFISLTPETFKKFLPVKLMLQLKEFYYFNKIILGIQYDLESDLPFITRLYDDLNSLESTLIIEKDGYYSRVISITDSYYQKILRFYGSKDLLTTSGILRII